jgi:hypothetical protein
MKMTPNERQIRGGQIAELSYEQHVIKKTSVFSKNYINDISRFINQTHALD